ncbi:hypothetical protein A8C32_17435 [Flavivirga aquatica]|uniref:Four helix bundle protein n=1 Tax=Flavivirga aquatica TaxID=1849968 RepID=A0A1E5T883_9FLAO|nr:four helix bundle protein [Flavivirga aquatica]OEK07580.1 hypothetical protein A8C32_17435 [Flavivirga aquatica]
MTARHNYGKLTIWKDDISIVKEAYSTTKKFPKSEVYALSSQMQRCSISIPSNITEVTSKGTDKHFLQYLETTLGSASEWENQLIILFEIRYITEETFKHL